MAETKLFRVTSGRIYDVIVDLRSESPTFGRWTSVELSADEPQLLLVPVTGAPEAAAHVALDAFEHRKHVVMVHDGPGRRQGRLLRIDDVRVPPDRLIDRLRAEQLHAGPPVPGPVRGPADRDYHPVVSVVGDQRAHVGVAGDVTPQPRPSAFVRCGRSMVSGPTQRPLRWNRRLKHDFVVDVDRLTQVVDAACGGDPDRTPKRVG